MTRLVIAAYVTRRRNVLRFFDNPYAACIACVISTRDNIQSVLRTHLDRMLDDASYNPDSLQMHLIVCGCFANTPCVCVCVFGNISVEYARGKFWSKKRVVCT